MWTFLQYRNVTLKCGSNDLFVAEYSEYYSTTMRCSVLYCLPVCGCSTKLHRMIIIESTCFGRFKGVYWLPGDVEKCRKWKWGGLGPSDMMDVQVEIPEYAWERICDPDGDVISWKLFFHIDIGIVIDIPIRFFNRHSRSPFSSWKGLKTKLNCQSIDHRIATTIDRRMET